jgi:tetratricopeptide (TPR) repeat protein
MARVVKLPITPPGKLGPTRARKRGKPNPEDFGQLNLFTQGHDTKVISLNRAVNYFEEAVRLDESGDLNAIQLYHLAIERDDNTEDALCNLGILQAAQNEHSRALDAFTRCLTLNPRHLEAHYNLANLYADLGNLPLARVHYEMAIGISPEYPNSYYNLALVLISQKDYKAAIEKIHQYIALTPEGDKRTAHDLIKTLNAIAT